MPRMQHRVTLTPDHRNALLALLKRGTTTAQTQRRARILLQTDRAPTHQRGRTDREVAAAVQVSARTVARVWAAWIAQGMGCLQRPPRPKTPKLDATAEVRLIALACSAPPQGHAVWSLRLLSRHAVELQIVDTVSYETVRRTLKKTSSSPGPLSGS